MAQGFCGADGCDGMIVLGYVANPTRWNVVRTENNTHVVIGELVRSDDGWCYTTKTGIAHSISDLRRVTHLALHADDDLSILELTGEVYGVTVPVPRGHNPNEMCADW